MSRRSLPPTLEADPARARLPWWDAIWERLPTSTRRTLVDLAMGGDVSAEGADVARLIEQGLFEEGADGRWGFPADAEAFVVRIRRLASAPVLFSTTAEGLERTIEAVSGRAGLLELGLRAVGPDADPRRVVGTPEWLRRMPPLLEQLPGVRRALGLLAANMGLVSLQAWCEELGAEAYPALDTLVAHLVVFEGLEPTTLRLMVGLLPALRGEHEDPDLDDEGDDMDDEGGDEGEGGEGDELSVLRVLRGLRDGAPAPSASAARSANAPRSASASKPARRQPRRPPPPAVELPPPVPRPAELDVTGPPRLLTDLEALLLTLAEQRVRVSTRGELYVDDEAALDEALGGCRVVPVGIRRALALSVARALGLVSVVGGGSARAPRLLRPSDAAAAFLEQPLARRWQEVVDLLRDQERSDWLGGELEHLAIKLGGWSVTPARMLELIRPITALEPGRFYELRALFQVFAREANPLLRLFVERQVERGVMVDDWTPLLRSQLYYVLDPEQLRDPLAALDRAFAHGLRRLLERLSVIGGVELGDVLGERATLALTDVGRYHLGLLERFPAVDEPPSESPSAAKVIVNPNLEVLVIGRAPRARLELARIAAPRGGESGPARTYVLSKERVIDAVGQGLGPDQVVKLLEGAARGAAVPENVTRTLRDWAGAVRRARVVYVPVLLADDEETALTIRSFAGKDTVLPGHAVPVNPAKFAAFKRTLRQKGVVLDDPGAPDDRRRSRARSRPEWMPPGVPEPPW